MYGDGAANDNKGPAPVSSYDSTTDEEPQPFGTQLIGPSRPLPSTPGHRLIFEVDFISADDQNHPLNWSWTRKILGLAMLSFTTLTVGWNSAIIAPGIPGIMETFHMGSVVATLNISLYVLGFAVGPIIWGPASELYGRRPPLLLSQFLFVCFTFASATAKDFQTLVLCRFFSGATGVGALVVVPAYVADVMETKHRGTGIALFTLMVIAGPMLAPVVGGFISDSYLGWRWTQYLSGIMAGAMLALNTFFIRESYPPVILMRLAQDLRISTGNWALYAPHETLELNLKEIFNRTILKPIAMMALEPILLFVSLYHGFIYGILYLCLEAVPIIFTEKYHWKGGVPYLPYLGMLVGAFLVCVCDLLFFQRQFMKDLKRSGKTVLPEARLPLMMTAGILFPAGIFLMCWSGNYQVHWIVPTIGLALIGFGLIGIFMAAFNYLIDTYLMLSASAIAANTFARSAMGAAFPLFARAMFHNLGIQWAGTLLGCLGALLMPVPFLFYFFGLKIRTFSRFAVNMDQLSMHEPRSRSVYEDPADREEEADAALKFCAQPFDNQTNMLHPPAEPFQDRGLPQTSEDIRPSQD